MRLSNLVSGGATISALLVAFPAGAANYVYSGSLAYFTAPTTGVYEIDAAGAQGGADDLDQFIGALGGNGARVAGDIVLTAGETLTVLVGGSGASMGGDGGSGGSGGGMSFVALGGAPLIVAGGGGGPNWFSFVSGGDGQAFVAGQVNSGLGGATIPGAGGGGGGWLGDGASGGLGVGGSGGLGPSTFAGGAGYPGTETDTGVGASGGYGGGGGAAYNGGGGGGGYTGGSAASGAGQGGSSYASPLVTNISSLSGDNGGNGYVDLAFVSFIAVPEPSAWAMMLIGISGMGVGLRMRRKSMAVTA